MTRNSPIRSAGPDFAALAALFLVVTIGGDYAVRSARGDELPPAASAASAASEASAASAASAAPANSPKRPPKIGTAVGFEVSACAKAAAARFHAEIPLIAAAHASDAAGLALAYESRKQELLGTDALEAACGPAKP